jgi:hypothetical protein
VDGLMSIPTYKEWMDGTTLGITKPRSAQLKALDQALLEYDKLKNDKTLWRLKNAFEDWKRYKGLPWEGSERNKTRIITNLNLELNTVADYRTFQITHFSMKELVALQYMAKERKKLIENIFKDKTVNFKLAKLKDQAIAAKESVKRTSTEAASFIASKFQSGPPKPPSGRPISEIIREKMVDMVQSFFGVSGLEQIGELSGLIISMLGECAVSIPPVVGQIKDGYDLFVGWAKVGAAVYEEHGVDNRKYAIDIGAPSAAFGALAKCLAEERNNELASASSATASFALKTGLAFLDGGVISGPVVGAGKALADFAQKLYLLGTEWRATKAINRALAAGELDIRLFRTYPLMGCYLLVSATLSDLIPVESFGTPGWMDYIEHLKKHGFDQIYGSATKLIDDSPWEMIGLPKRPKGTTGSLFSSVKTMWSTASPLADLKELGSI